MPLETVQDRLSVVVETLVDNSASIIGVWPLTTGYFSVPMETPLEEGRLLCKTAVRALSAHAGDDIRLLHGETRCLHGHVGTSRRLDYQVLLPNTGDLIAILLHMDFGAVEEVRHVGGQWTSAP